MNHVQVKVSQIKRKSLVDFTHFGNRSDVVIPVKDWLQKIVFLDEEAKLSVICNIIVESFLLIQWLSKRIYVASENDHTAYGIAMYTLRSP